MKGNRARTDKLVTCLRPHDPYQKETNTVMVHLSTDCNCLLDILQPQAILDKSLRRGGLPSDLMVSIYAAKEHNLALVHLFYRLLLEAEFKQDKSVTISQGDSRLVWIHIQFNDSKIYMFQNICKTFPFSPCHLPFLVKIITMCFIKNNDMK